MPKSLLAKSRNRDRFFDDEGKQLRWFLLCNVALTFLSDKLPSPSTFPLSPLERICQNPQLSAAKKASFLDFIQLMVKLEPEERPNTGKLLEAQWLKSA